MILNTQLTAVITEVRLDDLKIPPNISPSVILLL